MHNYFLRVVADFHKDPLKIKYKTTSVKLKKKCVRMPLPTLVRAYRT